MAAVFNGFVTHAQALRAEYMIKHQPRSMRHPVAIVARVATVQATCSHLLRTDRKFRGTEALAWEENLYQAARSLTSVADDSVTLQYVG
jgi:hypothetical protein